MRYPLTDGFSDVFREFPEKKKERGTSIHPGIKHNNKTTIVNLLLNIDGTLLFAVVKGGQVTLQHKPCHFVRQFRASLQKRPKNVGKYLGWVLVIIFERS